MSNEGEQVQLAPSHLHHRNVIKQVIQTFKNNVIAWLDSMQDNFPLRPWFWILLPQEILTLNLLRPYRLNPKLSVHAQLHVQFDYNATPVALPATRTTVHIKPSIINRWKYCGSNGIDDDRVKDHYRWYNIYTPQTRAFIHPDTVEFSHATQNTIHIVSWKYNHCSNRYQPCPKKSNPSSPFH